MKSEVVLYGGIACVIALVTGVFMMNSGGDEDTAQQAAAPKIAGKVAYEQPRSAEPMMEYTRFFTGKKFINENGLRKRGQIYYLLSPPEPYPAGLKFPLVVVLHGKEGVAEGAVYMLSKSMRLNYPAFVLVPQAPKNATWASAGKDKRAAYLPSVIDQIGALIQSKPVDTDRIYVIGCDEGGTGAFGAAAQYPEVFAAAVPINGIWNKKDDAGVMAGVPLLALHGKTVVGKKKAAAPDVDPAAEMVAAITAAGGQAYYTDLPQADSCASPYFYVPAMWKWMFQQHKAPAPAAPEAAAANDSALPAAEEEDRN